ncbi:uncharacterized protein LOC128888954 [Hylaeus anthracinus]|uniref:uncharacterized protein LOC128888954 n=1 Tax=Hylaeus anthracinus TaxID=313031 RepID=UPI0023B986BB|nr:uncharacterized protein LOC128888954 [Hylaeus anthracinus]
MVLVVFLLVLGFLVSTGQNDVDQCQRRTDEQLIWEYDVRRSYRIGGYQEVEAEYGPTNATITCIGVDPVSDENNGAMWVTSGGIGHNFIKIKFRSKYSRGLRYRVYVYGKPH